jgi:hypothetical protein
MDLKKILDELRLNYVAKEGWCFCDGFIPVYDQHKHENYSGKTTILLQSLLKMHHNKQPIEIGADIPEQYLPIEVTEGSTDGQKYTATDQLCDSEVIFNVVDEDISFQNTDDQHGLNFEDNTDVNTNELFYSQCISIVKEMSKHCHNNWELWKDVKHGLNGLLTDVIKHGSTQNHNVGNNNLVSSNSRLKRVFSLEEKVQSIL